MLSDICLYRIAVLLCTESQKSALVPQTATSDDKPLCNRGRLECISTACLGLQHKLLTAVLPDWLWPMDLEDPIEMPGRDRHRILKSRIYGHPVPAYPDTDVLEHHPGWIRVTRIRMCEWDREPG